MSALNVRTGPADYAGLATLTGGILLLTAFALDAATGVFSATGIPGSIEWLVAYGLMLIAGFLISIGLAGIVVKNGRDLGTATIIGVGIGAVGFFAIGVGSLMDIGYTGSAVETTIGGQFWFAGLLLVVIAMFVTGIGLIHHHIASYTGAVMLLATIAFVVGFLVGETVLEVTGVDIAWVVFVTSLCASWALLGYKARDDAQLGTTDRVSTTL